MNVVTLEREGAVTAAYERLVESVFRRAAQDCISGDRETAIAAMNFLCSDRAETLVAYVGIEQAGSAVARIARRCWSCARDRLGLTIEDIDGA